MADHNPYPTINNLARKFTSEMKQLMLSAAEDKGTDWEENTVPELVTQARIRLDDAIKALNRDDFHAAMAKLAGAANFCMMAWDNVEQGRGL